MHHRKYTVYTLMIVHEYNIKLGNGNTQQQEANVASKLKLNETGKNIKSKLELASFRGIIQL